MTPTQRKALAYIEQFPNLSGFDLRLRAKIAPTTLARLEKVEWISAPYSIERYEVTYLRRKWRLTPKGLAALSNPSDGPAG